MAKISEMPHEELKGVYWTPGRPRNILSKETVQEMQMLGEVIAQMQKSISAMQKEIKEIKQNLSL